MFKRIFLSVMGVFLSLSALSAHAAVDTTAITAAIADAATGLNAVQLAFIALSTGILAIGLVLTFIRRRAGA